MMKIAALLFGAAVAGYALFALAQGRAEIRTAITPIGSASSNGVSVAWFYDAADRTVYACRTGHGSGDVVECKGKAVLP